MVEILIAEGGMLHIQDSSYHLYLLFLILINFIPSLLCLWMVSPALSVQHTNGGNVFASADCRFLDSMCLLIMIKTCSMGALAAWRRCFIC